MATSNDTRVRRLGFWKIIARVFPNSAGLLPAVKCSCLSLDASLSRLSNSMVEKSSMARKLHMNCISSFCVLGRNLECC